MFFELEHVEKFLKVEKHIHDRISTLNITQNKYITVFRFLREHVYILTSLFIKTACLGTTANNNI